MDDQPAERLAQAFRDLMEQHQQEHQQRQRRIAELETELSQPAAGYRRQSAAVMPGSGQDLAEYYDWRQAREQELAELRQRQQVVEHDTIPRIARHEADDIIRQEARAAMPAQTDGKHGQVDLEKLMSKADPHRPAAGFTTQAPRR